MRFRILLATTTLLASSGLISASPITLDEAVRSALAKNYSVRISQLDTSISNAQVTAAWGKFDPAIELNYSYSDNSSPTPPDPFNQLPSSITQQQYSGSGGLNGLLPFGTQYSFGVNGQDYVTGHTVGQHYTFAGVSLTQPLLKNFWFGANLADIRIAKTDRSRSEWEYKQSAMDLITNVIFAYQELHYAKETLKVSERARAAAANLVTENERRFSVGDRSHNDIVAAQARVAEREEAVLFAQRSVVDQANRLRQLISDDHSAALLSLPMEIADPTEPTRPKVDPAADFAHALIDRPDYQEARLLVQRNRYNRSYRANQVLPELNFVGSYGYGGFGTSWSASRSDLRDQDRRSYSAGAVLRIPLTFTQERGLYRAAKLELQKSEIQLQQLEQAIMIDLAAAAGQVETTHQRVIVTTRARQLAQQTLDDEIKKLHAGTSSTFFVLQYQEQLAGAELAEYRARTDEQRAIAEYDRQTGMTLRRWHVSIVGDKAPKS